MKRTLRGILIASSLVLLTACGAGKTDASQPVDGTKSAAKQTDGMTETKNTDAAASDAYHKITAEEAKKMLDEGGVTLVDVRTEAEYKEKHIENALLIPNETITTEPSEELPDKSATVLLYCRSGRRSKEAADKLVAMGYEKVYDFGGIKDWPYDTVTEK